MDIKKEKKAIKNLKAFYMEDWNLTEEERDDLDNLVSRIVAVVKTEAQAVPEVINVGNELQSWVAVWSFKARHDREDYIVVDANLLADKIEKLTGANA